MHTHKYLLKVSILKNEIGIKSQKGMQTSYRLKICGGKDSHAHVSLSNESKS